MVRRTRNTIYAAAVTLFVLLCPHVCRAEEQNKMDELTRLRLIKEAYVKMNAYYYKEIPQTAVVNLFYRSQFVMMNLLRSLNDEYKANLNKLTYSIINMMVETLKDPTDTYSKFIYKDYLKRVLRENLISKFAGIGIEVEQREMLYFISRVYEDSSASEHGILKGDQLLKIADQDVTGLALKKIEKMLKIPDGESVGLTLLHKGDTEPYAATLVCRIIRIPSVSSEYYDTTKIGYIQINKFRNLTGEEFTDAFTLLQKKKLKGLILDLRGNTGGDETQVLEMCSVFLPDKSLVAYFMKRDIGRQEEHTSGKPIKISYPVIILVDKKTGSSAEIFAGTMAHYNKAIVVGKRTSGKGSLKNTFPLHDGSALFLITSRTFLPDGSTFDQKGIEPNVVVKEQKEQLQKAIDIIMGNEKVQGLRS